jgi:hypothetical protein
MSQLSKVKHGRNQWKAKAKQRSGDNRYLRKQLARVKAERDRAKQALKDTQMRLHQRESHAQTVAVRPKVDVVWLSLRLFLARIIHQPEKSTKASTFEVRVAPSPAASQAHHEPKSSL